MSFVPLCAPKIPVVEQFLVHIEAQNS